jgi:hypothetical protein
VPDEKQLHRDTIWLVRAFACPVCNGFAAFESLRCPTCETTLGFHLPTMSMVPLVDDVAHIDNQQWVRCTQSETSGCNWSVPEEQAPEARGMVPRGLDDPTGTPSRRHDRAGEACADRENLASLGVPTR